MTEIIANIIFALICFGAIAFGVFLIKSWLDFGAPIASISYDPEKWAQEKRIIEGLAHAENCRLRWENTWHELSGTPIDQDAHNQYLKNRARHTQLMEKHGRVYCLK